MKPTQHSNRPESGPAARKAKLAHDRKPAPDAERPDEERVADVEEAEAHAAEHEAEQGGDDVESGAQPDDVKKGFSQDSGYAQSGGQRRGARGD
jgi:hypothetical protein